MPERATAVRLRFFTANSKTIKPTFYLQDDGFEVARAEHPTLLAAVNARVSTSGLMAAFTNAYNYVGSEAQNVQVEGPSAAYPNGRLVAITAPVLDGDLLPGTAVGESPPPQISTVYSMRTALPGSRGRGRMYLPPPPELQVDSSGVISEVWAADLEDDVDAVILAAVQSDPGGDYEHVIVSRKFDSAEEVLDKSIRRVARTQRRRTFA